MKPLKEFIIPFVGLKLGKHHFDYYIDGTFFEYFEYDDFNAVEVNVDMVFDKKASFFELDFSVEGFVNVNCDVTNESYNQDLKGDFHLVVKFGQEYNDENEEVLILPHGEYEINIAQYIYELIVLSVPVKRIHPGVEDGSLKSDILDKLEELSPGGEQKKESNEDIDPRWNTLKNLLTANIKIIDPIISELSGLDEALKSENLIDISNIAISKNLQPILNYDISNVKDQSKYEISEFS